MCRRHRREVGYKPSFRLLFNYPKSLQRQCLLLVGVLLSGLNFGCHTTSQGQRSFVFNPLQSVRTNAERPRADVSAGQQSEQAKKATLDIEPSDIRQASNQREVESAPPEASSKSMAATETQGATVELPSSGLTLGELEALAMQNNPTLSQALAAISAEQGIYRQAGLYPNPQIGYLNGSASAPGVKQSNGMFYSQEFVIGNKLSLAQNSASVEIKRYQWDHESQRMRIMNDLKIRYYEVLGAQEALAVSERLVKIAEKTLAMAEKRMEGIHGTKIDLLQARVQLETVKLTRDEAEHRYLAAWEQLATIVGVSPIQRVPIVGDLTSDIPQLDLDTCLQTLMGNSPQIRSTECDLGHAWSTYREAKAQAIPNVTLQTVGEFDKVTQATTVSTLVAMPLPIFNRNQGNIDKSSADIIAAQAEVCRVQLVLRDQLTDSFRRYKTSLRQSERLGQVIVKSAEENLELTKQVYASGETSFSTVLTAQQTYFHSQIAYVEALTELHKVATEIQGLQLTGGLNPAAIGSAIQNMPGGGAQRQRALLNEVQDRASKQLLPAAQIGQ